MKKSIIAVVLLVAGVLFSQTTTQINRIQGMWNAPIRTALKAIATEEKTVSEKWTFSDTLVATHIIADTVTVVTLDSAYSKMSLSAVNEAGGSAKALTYAGTLGIMNGSDNFTAIDIAITNADHTSTGNTVYGVNVANITGDAHATETALNVGTGWDYGLYSLSPAFVTGINIGTSQAIVGTTAITIGDNNQTVAINSSDWDISTTGVMTGIGNITTDGDITMSHGKVIKGSTTTAQTIALQVYDVDGTAYQNAILLTNGDAPAIAIGSGGQQTVAINSADWDINVTGDMTGIGSIAMDGDLTMTKVNSAGGSANPFDYTGTLGIMNGSDDFTLFDVNITNANHTGESNTVQVLNVANITGDADATETAIKIGTGWDYGLFSLSPVHAGAGINLGTSQAIVGTTALTIGDNTQTVAVNSSDWDISTTGAMTGIGAITADGVLTVTQKAVVDSIKVGPSNLVITKIDTTGAGRWLRITVKPVGGGPAVAFFAIAAADTAAVKEL